MEKVDKHLKLLSGEVLRKVLKTRTVLWHHLFEQTDILSLLLYHFVVLQPVLFQLELAFE